MSVKVRARGAASVLAFSHLLGFNKPAKAAKAEDDDNKDDPAAEEGDEGDEDRKDSKKAKKAKAEDDDEKKDDPAADEGDEDKTDEDEKKDSKKARKAKAEDDDEECAEEDDEDEDVAAAARSGRRAERARWAGVLSNPAAGEGRVGIACKLLSTTPMSGAAIISALSEMPALTAPRGGRRSLDERMEAEKPANPGADGQAPKPGSAAANAAAIIRAGKKRRGEPV